MTLRPLIPICLLVLVAVSEADVDYIPATPENTRLADGSPLPADLASCGWKWLPDEGNGGILESTENASPDSPPLRVVIGELEANADYEVFGYFWAPGFGKDDAKAKHVHWPARFGLGLASLTTYGGKHSSRIPWIISPGSEIGRREGYLAVIEESDPITKHDKAMVTAVADTRLIRARVGVARSDAKGVLSVVADSFPDSIHCGKTRIDGIGIRKAPAGAEAKVGKVDSNALHLALRAGDLENAKREMAAGADANTLDFDGLAPLLYPAAFGDLETVRILLKAGADPNLPGQTILPLTAAATAGDAAMVRLLLDAGADVPPGKPEADTRFDSGRLDPCVYHPAIAAIRSGSLESLKLLLAKRPDLDLEALGPEFQTAPGEDNSATSLYLVHDAVRMEHDELAAFLIDRGCALRSHIRLDASNSRDFAHAGLMVRSITEGNALAKTREAIFRRGVRTVLPRNEWLEGVTSWYHYQLCPWDALSAAVRMGDVALVTRLLPQAAEMNEVYQELLLALAFSSDDPQIIRMVRAQFPNADSRLPAYAKAKDAEQEAHDDAALRMLLPRTKAAAARPDAREGEWTMAVISSPKAGGQAASLEALASNQDGWSVVDRADIATALSEQRFANTWENGRHHLADLGDTLSADLLILVSAMDAPGISLLRFEAVDVATGLAVFREHIESRSFDPEKSTAPLFARIRAAFTNARSGERPTAVTMLPFSVAEEMPNAGGLSAQFRAAIHAEVDATPGVLSVGMSEIKAISNEQTLGGKDGLWAAAFTLEGGVSALAEGRVSLTLRLLPLGTEGGKPIDVKEEGRIEEIPLLAARAWRSLVDAQGISGGKENVAAKPDARQSALEAERLLREGEWLMKFASRDEALPLIERASLLGAAPEPLVSKHLQALASGIHFYAKPVDLTSLQGIHEHSLSLFYQQRLVNALEPARALLDQAAFYQARHGKASLGWSNGGKDFWNVLKLLSFIRASVPNALLSGESVDSFRDFSDELDRYTAEYFRIRSSMPDPTLAPQIGYSAEDISAAMLRRNPELLKGWVTMFFLSSSSTPGIRYNNKMLFYLLSDDFDRGSGWYGKTRLLAGEIAARMDEYRGPHRKLRDHELAYIRSYGEDKAVATRNLLEALARLGRRNLIHLPMWTRVAPRSTIAELLDRSGPTNGLRHSGEMIPSLVQRPAWAPDWIIRPEYVRTAGRLVHLEELPAGSPEKNTLSVDFRKYYPEWLEYLRKTMDENVAAKELLEAAGLVELIYGIPLYDHFAKQWRSLLAPQHTDAPAVPVARLLADLRKSPDPMPGLFETPIIDNTDRNRLWLRYHPFEQGKTGLSGVVADRVKRRQPWLVSVDCESGSLDVSVNLARAPGLDPGPTLTHSYNPGIEEDGFLAQTNDTILTNAVWGHAGRASKTIGKVGVLISKKDGTMTPLNPSGPIGSPSGISGDFSAGAVALGGEFLFLQQAGDLAAFYGARRMVPFQLMRVAPGGKVRPVTEHGRRPELTPFDPADRSPKVILRDGKRLLVYHSWEHIGWFNPEDDSWEMDKRNAQQTRAATSKLTSADYHSRIFPHHRIAGQGKDPVVVIDSQTLHSHKLFYGSGGKGKQQAEIRLEIPDDYREEASFVDGRKSGADLGGTHSFDEMEAKGRFKIVVLNQTENDLILGLWIDHKQNWQVGAHASLHLPLLWAIPKKDLLEALKSTTGK